MAKINLTAEQQKVVDTRNCNLLVAAAAGSGKTAVLVKRIIKKVTEENQDIDRLLIVTFTNAAAAEMRERIGAAVEAALEQNPESAHLQRQMLLLHHAQITTIHSFCLSVIREFFHLLSLDPGFRIGDEAELSLLKADVLEEVLEEYYEKEDAGFTSFVESFGSAKNDDAIKGYIMKLYETAMSQPYAKKWLDSLLDGFMLSKEEFGKHPMLSEIMQRVKACLADCKKIVDRMIRLSEEPEGPTAYRENFLADLEELECLEVATRDYSTFFGALEELKWKALSRKKQEASEEKKQLAKDLRDELKGQLKKLKEDFFYAEPGELWQDMVHMRLPMQGLLAVTTEFISRYEAKKRLQNLLDFNDLEHMALRILVEQDEDGIPQPTAAAKILSGRFDEIMIDEYQDSNQVQELVLTSVSGAWKNTPNVFMVGDVKQSIYRFRMACPDLFIQKYESYGSEGAAQKIELSKNFRSRKGTLDAINVLFAGLMHKDSTEVEYDAAASLYFGAKEQYPEEKDFHRPEVLFVSTKKPEEEGEGKKEYDGEKEWQASDEEVSEEPGMDAAKTEDGDLSQEEKTLVQAEAYAVARRIRELMQSEFTIGNRGEEHKAGYGDMVVLLRTMSGWSEAFLEVFAEQGIPAYADTSTGYFKTFEIRKTLDFLRILDNPKQDIPFAAVLHSPIGDFNAEELAVLRVKYGGVSAKQKTNKCLYDAARAAAKDALGTGFDDVCSKAARFFAVYDRLRAEAGYLSIHELIERFYKVSGFYDVVTVMPGGERRRGNLEMLVARAKQYESTSFSGLYDFIRYVDRLIKYEVDFGEANDGAAGQMVRIMSIHKSKGLEFPVVFLCGMEKKMNRMDMRSRLIFHGTLGLGPEFVDTKLRVKAPTLLKKVITNQMNGEMIAEELRVLYVAMTRAREKLIMVGAAKEPEKRYEKWQQCAETVNAQGMLGSYILKANCYYDFICPLLFAAVRQAEGTPAGSGWTTAFKNGMPVLLEKQMETEDFPEARFSGQFELREYGADEAEVETEQVQRSKQELLAILEEMKSMEAEASDKARELRALLDLQEQYEYPYGTAANLPVKVTVSELKRLAMQISTETGDEEADRVDSTAVQNLIPEEIPFEELDSQEGLAMQEMTAEEAVLPEEDCTYPEFLKPEKTISGADRGTLYHHVMELIPFREGIKKDDIRVMLDAMVQDGKLTMEEREEIYDYKLEKFFSSGLGKRMCRAEDAGKLHREQPFVMGLSAKELYPESDSEEIVLVQGIIDAFFEEEDGLVLMDYKTDYIHEDAKRELTRKYQSQLKYYCMALNKLTGKQVKEIWFYSFAKNEDVRMD